MGHECVDGAGSVGDGCLGFGLDDGGVGTEAVVKAGMAPADFIYRIATVTAVIYMLATLL